MYTFPILYTNRLKLRKMQFEDMSFLVKYANNKKIADRIINIPHPYREPDAAFRMSFIVQGFKKKIRYVFAIALKENDEFIGEISLHLHKNIRNAELGYWLGEPFWNQGIMTEAIEAILQFGANKLELEQIYASCKTDNHASQQILLKNGFTQNTTNGNVIEFKHQS